MASTTATRAGGGCWGVWAVHVIERSQAVIQSFDELNNSVDLGQISFASIILFPVRSSVRQVVAIVLFGIKPLISLGLGGFIHPARQPEAAGTQRY